MYIVLCSRPCVSLVDLCIHCPQYIMAHEQLYHMCIFYSTSTKVQFSRVLPSSIPSQDVCIIHDICFRTYNIRLYHECEGRIERSVPRIAVWHHEACRVMTNGDPEGRIFVSYPHTKNGLLLLLTYVFIYLF